MLDNLNNDQKLDFKLEVKKMLVQYDFEKNPMVSIFPNYINVSGMWKGIKVIFKITDVENIYINIGLDFKSKEHQKLREYATRIMQIHEKYYLIENEELNIPCDVTVVPYCINNEVDK